MQINDHQLTPAQEDHLRSIKMDFEAAVDRKYRLGAAEHGGNVWDMTPLRLCDEAIAEAIDQVTFLLTLRRKLEAADQEMFRKELEEAKKE